jgi:glycosyltransferase involved in cell wall biosynthesis
MRLSLDGRVAEGWTHAVRYWWFEKAELVLGGSDGQPTCRLRECEAGCWTGASLRDRGIVELRLTNGATLPRTRTVVTLRPGSDIAFVGNAHFQDGIGKSILAAKELLSRRANLWFINKGRFDPASFPDQRFASYLSDHSVPKQAVPSNAAVFAYVPPSDAAAVLPASFGPRVIYTMFEADRLPPGWKEAFEHFDQVLCPAPFFLDALRSSGVTKPAAAFDQGIVIPPLRRARRPGRPFVFAFSASASPRKNLEGTIRAFQRAFPDDSGVRLRLQARWGSLRRETEKLVGKDKRIEFHWSDLSDAAYEKWWNEVDCYLALSKAEGYGMTPREAILRGIPTIASNNSGHATIPERYYFPVPTVGMEPALCDYWKEPIGEYWTPDLDVAAEHMRYVRDNYQEAQAKTRIARRENWHRDLSFARMAERLLPYLRPRVVMLCPSFGQNCGIAEYTRYVQAELIRAGSGCIVVTTARRAYEIAASTKSVTHVLVQHEYAFFDHRNPRFDQGDTTIGLLELLGTLQKQRRSVKAIVLMHTYSEKNGETEPNRLLKESGIELAHFSQEGCERLGARFVEHGIQPVEGWTPKQRSRSGQFTIGTFGILGEHRPVEQIVEICRRTGSRLLASFSCEDTRKAGLERLMSEAGIDFDLWTDFPADRELLERLSACDVIYMPRRENDLWCASGAIRLAMNLDRPIIVNRVQCYADLGNVLTFADSIDDAVREVERFGDEREAALAVSRIDGFRRNNGVGTVYQRLIDDTAKRRASMKRAAV